MQDILELIHKAKKEITKKGPFFGILDVKKAVFVGDTHGEIRVTEHVLSNYRTYTKVFLGDYVDRGNKGVENLELILREYLKHPARVVILRGNHESPLLNADYGFMAEVNEKLGKNEYEEFSDFFSYLPYAAIVNGYFCVHGGIAEGIERVEEIKALPWPDMIPSDRRAFELLWNDPNDGITGFADNIRGGRARYFGLNVVEHFLKTNKLRGIIRAHQVADGFKFNAGGKVITVFSAEYAGYAPGIIEAEGDELKFIRL